MKRLLSLLLIATILCGLFAGVTVAAETTATTVYLKPNSNWLQDNPRFAAYFFGNGEKWLNCTDPDGDGIYEVQVPAGYTQMIFCRMNPSTTANNWNNKWNQTADLTIPASTDKKVCYHVSGWDKGNGQWVEMDGEPEEVKVIYYVKGNFNGDTNWAKSYEMTPNADGTIWTVTMELPAGSYEYKINSNNDYWSPGSNVSLVLTEDSKVTFTFVVEGDQISHEITPKETKPTEAPEEEEPTGSGRFLYVKPNADWLKDGARFAAYFFNDGGNTWVDCTTSSVDGVWQVEIPVDFAGGKVIFCRMKPANTENNWDNKWNQTSDLPIPAEDDEKICYHVVGGDKGNGQWTKLGDEPEAVKTIYYVAGSFGTEGWDKHHEMTESADGASWSLSMDLEAGTYEYKVKDNGAGWWPEANVQLVLEQDSTVEFTIDVATKTVTHKITPKAVEPEDTTPETTVPEDTTPETTAPEDTTPETTVPEDTTPETTAPEDTTPETTAPEDTTPETTAPEDTTPETTAPESKPTEPETTEPEGDGTRILYVKPNAGWLESEARFAAYFFNDEGNTWVDCSASTVAGVWQVEIPADFADGQVIFCRMNPATTENNWDNKWNQTSDLPIPAADDNKTCYHVVGWDHGAGQWTKLGDEPEAVKTIYYVAGSFGTEGWNKHHQMTESADGATWSLSMDLKAGTYEYKVKDNGTGWWPEANVQLVLEQDATVEFTIDVATKAVTHKITPKTVDPDATEPKPTEPEATEPKPTTPDNPDTIVVYAQVPESWTDVGVYIWDASGKYDAAWPGIQMTKGADGWYTAEVPAWAENIIINNNGNGAQTQDMAITVGRDLWIVVEAAESGFVGTVSYESAKTGDTTNLIALSVAMLLAAAGMVTLVIKKKEF